MSEAETGMVPDNIGHQHVDSRGRGYSCVPEADLARERQRAEQYQKVWHPEEEHRCGECGGPHMVDTTLPSSIWNQIARPEESLCTLCIEARLQAKGISGVLCKFYYAGEAMMGQLYDEDSDATVQEWATQAHKHAEAAAANYQRAERAEAELEDAEQRFRDEADDFARLNDEANTLRAELEALRAKGTCLHMDNVQPTIAGDDWCADCSAIAGGLYEDGQVSWWREPTLTATPPDAEPGEQG